MDDKHLQDLKKEAIIDNSQLEEIIKKDITPEMQKEFFEVFKDSQLFMPVSFSADMFKGLESAKPGDVLETPKQTGFDINYLKNSDGEKAVPLFTSDKVMQEAGVKSSVFVLYMSDLAEMLKQSDEYSTVVVNPFTPSELNIPIEGFLNLFREVSDEEKEFLDSINELLHALKEHSVELEENSTLFIRLDENLMVDNAVDGVFTPPIPFYASSNPKYREDLKYTHILLMPKSKKILPIGPVENGMDIVIAPGTEFNLEDRLDEFTSLWMCGEQPFYGDD
ncbi:SseB family protein [Methanobrevibacter sp.]|uniref:SseB family protein n=1 Tax=Methanobrevibacter sp. TaxID=66852 RepID=UPI00388FF028